MKVAGLAVWGAALRRTKLTDEQVPLSLSTLASALPLEQGDIGLFRSVPEQMEQVEQFVYARIIQPQTNSSSKSSFGAQNGNLRNYRSAHG